MRNTNHLPELLISGITVPHGDFPDRMTISIENGPDIVIIRTDVGYVVDAYPANGGDLISTLNVWDDDLKEDEKNA